MHSSYFRKMQPCIQFQKTGLKCTSFLSSLGFVHDGSLNFYSMFSFSTSFCHFLVCSALLGWGPSYAAHSLIK
jgi:hypothetical protein